MKRKIISLFVSLCMILPLLPTAAMAAGVAPAADNAALVIDEASGIEEISEDVAGAVLVTAAVKLSIKAVVDQLYVMSEGADVTITGESSVGAVVVLAAATVKVEETAAVSNITVDEDAGGATVVVAEAARVTSLDVNAAGAAVEVKGEVAAVTVAETAAGAKLILAETARVETVSSAAPEADILISGSAAAVEVTGASSNVAVTGTAVVSSLKTTGDVITSVEENAAVENEKTVEADGTDEDAAGAVTRANDIPVSTADDIHLSTAADTGTDNNNDSAADPPAEETENTVDAAYDSESKILTVTYTKPADGSEATVTITKGGDTVSFASKINNSAEADGNVVIVIDFFALIPEEEGEYMYTVSVTYSDETEVTDTFTVTVMEEEDDDDFCEYAWGETEEAQDAARAAADGGTETGGGCDDAQAEEISAAGPQSCADETCAAESAAG